MNRVTAIIQARTGSSRLPGKVLMDIAGCTMLERVCRRTAMANRVDDVLVATSVELTDDPIEQLCSELSLPCFRGSEDDVLDRFYRAAVESGSDTFVRITSDCPLIDPSVIDLVIDKFQAGGQGLDYCCNFLPDWTFPRGLCTEVFSLPALERSWKEDTNPAWREHVDEYILHNQGDFKIESVTSDTDYSSLRWTVDTAEDLEFVRNVYGGFDSDGFSWRDVLALVDSHPEWLELNRAIKQKEVE